MTDIRANLGAQRLAGEQKRHRHRWMAAAVYQADGGQHSAKLCQSCGAIKDEAATRKGRNNRARGNSYERDVARRLGGTRIGQYGGSSDVQTGELNIQCKVGSYFPERIWRWLDALPADGRLPMVVIGDAPGAGHKRRELVCLDLDDFIDLLGGNE